MEKINNELSKDEAIRLIQAAGEVSGWFDDDGNMVVEDENEKIILVLSVDSIVLDEVMQSMCN